MANFIHINYYGLIITTNKITYPSNLNTIKKYIKNVNNIKSQDIMLPHLLQLKSYLKIIGISYMIENPNILIML